MNIRESITDAILKIVEEAAPDVRWASRLRGANRSDQIEGSISCDRVDYTYKAKGLTFARATYSIYLVDINSLEGVDEQADKVFVALHDRDIFGNCTKALITSVQYGAAKENSNVGVALLTLDIEYQI